MKKNYAHFLKSFLVSAICLTGFNSFSQLTINSGVDPNTLVSSFVSNGLTVSNVTMSCPTDAYGTFTNGLTTSIGISNGILLTTGNAGIAQGPNNSSSSGQDNGIVCADPQILSIEPAATFDCCILEFDVLVQCNSLTIRFAFGSEEYPEFVSAGVNDAFGFFVTGPNPAGGNYTNQNIATIPNGTPMSIDNVNATTNNTFYINNTGGATIQYDGHTTVVSSTLSLTPCETYHFKLAIADAGDGIYDSGVFIDFLTCTTPFSVSATSTPTGCSGNTGTATATVSGGVTPFTYTWSPAPGGGQGTANATGLAAGTYTVTVDDNYTCIPACSTTVTVGSAATPPTVSVTPSTTICNGNSTTLTASGATSYAWSPATGLSATTGASVTANPSSTTTYTVTGTDACGNGTATTTVTVNPVPALTATPASQTICSGQSTSISLSSTTPGTTFSWTVSQSGATGASNGSGSSIAQALTATGASAGTVTYTVTPTANGCTGTPQNITITVNPTPTITATPASQTLCSGQTTGISLTSGVPGTTFAWTVSQSGATGASNGSGTSIAQTLSASGSSAGTATYTITPTANGCPGTPTNVVVTVNPVPTVTATPASQTICSGQTTAVSLSSAVSGTTFAWTVSQSGVSGGSNGSGTSVAQTLSTTAAVAGTATYTITPTAAGCPGTPVNVVITVNPIPTVTAGNNGPLCVGQTLNLTSSVSGATYAWTGPGGFTSTQQNPSIGSAATSNAGTYSVTITVNGCTSTAATTFVNVNTAFDATINAVQPVCASATPFNLTAVDAGGTWSGTGITNAATGTFDPSLVTGSTTITYTISGSCGDTDTESITVNPSPTVSAGSNSPVCAGASLNLTATNVTNGSYSWSGPGTYSSGSQNPVINPAAASASGTYTVTVTDANNCTGTSTVSVTVNALPNVTVNSPSVCTGDTASLTANGAGTYVWSPSTGLSSTTGASVTAVTTGTATYTVTGTDANNCSNTATATVTVNTPPVASAGPDDILDCINPTLQLDGTGSASGAGITYVWSTTGGNITAGGTSTTPTVDQDATYTITVTNTNTGCSASDDVVISQDANAPNADAGAAQTINCINSTVTLDGSGTTGSNLTYSWSGPGMVSGGTTTTPVANQAGTYTLTVTNTVNGCTDNASVVVTVDTIAPATSAGNPQAIDCNNPQVTLTGAPSGAGNTYLWTTADGTIVSGANTSTAIVSAGGTYTLTVTGSNGCVSSDNVTITQTAGPVASFTVTPTTGLYPVNITTANTSTGTGISSSWSFGTGDVSTLTSPTYTYPEPGVYPLTLIVTDAAGCTDSMTVMITVFDDFAYMIPNIFTPNGDGPNDVFTVQSTGVKDVRARIYDRWGVFMHEWTGVGGSWDGRKDGKDAADGTYYYIIEIVKFSDEVITEHGHFTLTR